MHCHFCFPAVVQGAVMFIEADQFHLDKSEIMMTLNMARVNQVDC